MAVPHKLLVVSDKNLGCHVQTGAVCIVLGDQRGRRAAVRGLRCLIPCLAPSSDSDVPPLQTAALTGEWAALGGTSAFDSLLSKWCSGPSHAGDALRLAALASQAGDVGTFVSEGMLLAFPAGPLQVTVRSCCFVDAQGQRHPAVLLAPQQQGGTSALSPAVQHTTISQATSFAPPASSLAVDGVACCVTVMQYPGRVLFQNSRSRAYYGDLLPPNQELHLPSTISQQAHAERPGGSLPVAPQSHLQPDQPPPEGHVDGGTLLLLLLLQGCVEGRGAGQGAFEDMLQALSRGQEYEAVCQMPATFDGIPELAALGLSLASHLTAPDTTMSHASLSAAVAAAAAAAAPASPLCGTPVRREGSSGALQLPIPLCGGGRSTNSARGSSLGRAAAGPHSDTPINVEEELLLLDLSIGGGSCKGGGAASKFGGGNGSSSGVHYGARRSVSLTSMHRAPLVASGQASPVVSGSEGLSSSGASRSVTPRPRSQVQAGGARPNGRPSLSTMVSTRSRLAIVQTGSLFGSSTPPDGDAAYSLGYEQPSLAATATAAAAGLSPGPMSSSAASQVQDGLQKPLHGSSSWPAEELEQHVDAAQPPPAATLTPSLSSSTCRTATPVLPGPANSPACHPPLLPHATAVSASREPFPTEHVGAGTALGAQWHAPVHPSLGGLACVPSGSNALATETLQRLQAGVATAAAQRRRAVRRCTTTAALGASGAPGSGHSLAVGVDRESPRFALGRAGGRLEAVGGSGQPVPLQLAAEPTLRHQLQGEEAPGPWPQAGTEDDRTAPALPAATNSNFSEGEVAVVGVSGAAEKQVSLEGRLRVGVAGLQQHDAPAARNGWMDTASLQRLETTAGGAGPAAGLVCSAAMPSVQHGPAAPPPVRSCCVAGTRQQEDQPWPLQVHLAHKSVTQQDSTQGCGGLGQQLVHSSNVQGGQDAAGAGPVDSGNVRSAVQRIQQAGPPSAKLGRGLAVISGLSFTDVCAHEADDDVNETYAAAAFALKGDEHGGRGMGVEAVEDVAGFSGRLSPTRASLAAASGSTGRLGPIATAALGLARAAEGTTPAAARQGHGFRRQQRASSASGAARASSVSSSSGAATIAALVPAVAPSPIPSSPSRPPFPAHADMESASTPFAPSPQPFPPTASSDQHQGSLPVPVGLPGVSSPGASSSSSSSRTSVDPDALLLTSMQLSHAGTGATELTASLDVSALFTGALANTETHSHLSPFMATATTGAMFPERDACAAVRARAPRGEGEEAPVAAARAAAAGEACEPATKCAKDRLGALLALPRSSRGAAAEWSGGVPEAAAHILLHGGGVGLSDRQGCYAGMGMAACGQGSPAPGDCGPATDSPFTLTHLLGGVDELQQVGSGGSGDRDGTQPGVGWNAEEGQVDEQVEVEVELAVGAEVLAAGGRATRAADETGTQGDLATEADGLAEAGGSATRGGSGQGVDSPQGDALAAAAVVGQQQQQGQRGHQGVPMPLRNAGRVATSSGSWSDLSATAIRVMGFALPDSAPGPDNERQVAEAVPQAHRAAANPPLSPLASTITPYLPSRASASITFVPLPDPDGDSPMPSPTPLQQLAHTRPSTTTTTSLPCCSADDSRPTVAPCRACPAAAAEPQRPPEPLSKRPPSAPRAFGSTLLPTSSSALHASASNCTVASNAASSVHSAAHMLSEGSNALFEDDAAAAVGQPVGFSDGYLAVFGASASNMATWRRGGGGAGGGARSPSGKRWMVQAAVEGMDEGGVEGEFGLGDRKSAVDGGTGAQRRWQTQGQMADILEEEFGLGGANGCKYSSVGSILDGAHAGRRMHQKSGSAGTAASHVAMGTSPRPQGPGLGRVATTTDRLRLLFSSLQQQQMQMQLQQQAQLQQQFQMQRPQPIQVPQQSLSRAVSGMRGSVGGASFSGRSTCASPASAGRGTPPTPRRAPWACHTLAGQPPSRPQSLAGAEAFGGELAAVPQERRSAAADSPSLWSCRAAAGTGTGMGKSLPGEQRQPPGCSATGGVVSAMAFAATATAPHTSSLHGTMGPAAGAGAGAGAGPAASASAGAAAGAYMHQSSSQLTLPMMHGTATASSPGRTRWHKVVVVPCGVGPAGAAAGHGAGGSGGDGSGPVLTLAVTQIDVTEQVEAQEQLARLLEQEHKVLESIYPRHVIEYMTLQGVKQAGATCPGGGHGGVGGSLLSLCGGGDSVSRMASLATWHPGVTILFADIVGFTSMSSAAPPLAVMAFLNQLYSRFDGLVDIYKVYKVETIGDCYMVAGGLVACDEDGYRSVISGEEDPLHPVRVMEFAKAMLRAAREVRMPHTGEPVQLRIGLHSGPVTSGVVGDRMPRFCLFGDTVNVASRMESTCRPGAIHVSAATHARLQRESWLDRGLTAVKGKGDMRTYEWAGDADTPFDGGQLQRVIGLYL